MLAPREGIQARTRGRATRANRGERAQYSNVAFEYIALTNYSTVVIQPCSNLLYYGRPVVRATGHKNDNNNNNNDTTRNPGKDVYREI